MQKLLMNQGANIKNKLLPAAELQILKRKVNQRPIFGCELNCSRVSTLIDMTNT